MCRVSTLLFRRILNEKLLHPDEVIKAEQQSRKFLAKIDSIYQAIGGSDSMFIYGEKPTALDAHVLPFLCRLDDRKRAYLIPENLERLLRSFKSRGTLQALVSQ